MIAYIVHKGIAIHIIHYNTYYFCKLIYLKRMFKKIDWIVKSENTPLWNKI